MPRVLVPMIARGLLAAACCLLALAACGGGSGKTDGGKAKGTKAPPKPVDEGKAKAKATPPTPAKVEEARSPSGRTARELVDAIAESYKGLSPDGPADKLVAAETARHALLAELVVLGKGAVPRLVDALGHPSPEAAEWACIALGEIGDASAADALSKAALGQNQRLAVWACDALGRLKEIAGPLGKIAPLLQARPAANTWRDATVAGLLRNAAAEALTRGGEKSGIPVLIAGLEGEAEVRRDALLRLRRLTGKEVVITVDGPEAERKSGVAEWNRWWADAKGMFRPLNRESFDNHHVYAAKGG